MRLADCVRVPHIQRAVSELELHGTSLSACRYLDLHGRRPEAALRSAIMWGPVLESLLLEEVDAWK